MSRPLLPLSGFRAFEAAARHLSFARAADELRVTPAAISHQVRTLEDYLGVPLFRRSGRRVLLTEAGQILLPDLRRSFDLMEAAMGQVKRLAAGGILTVSMSPSFAAKWLMPRIEHFRARHPDIDLRIDADVRLVDFSANEVDIVIRYGPGSYPGLKSVLLFEEELFPVCSPRLLSGAVPLRGVADLRQHTLLHDETINFAGPIPSWRVWLQTIGLEQAVDLNRGLRFNSSVTATQAAVDGHGVLLGRSLIVADDLAAGRLVRPFAESCPAGFGYYLVYPPQVASRANVRAFVDWIIEEAAGKEARGARAEEA